MDINECWYKRKCTNKCSESCIRYRLMYSLFEQSMLPESQWFYKDLRCDEYGDYPAFMQLKDISDNIIDFVARGNQLYIYSETCGNGKTSWAIRLMYSYFDKIWHKSSLDCKALFVNTSKFLYNCKRSISQQVDGFEELCNKIADVDLVIWDDVTCAKVTDYEHQILFQYIDDRICSGKANIFTGNHDREECVATIGDRLPSRIFSEYAIEFVEGDKRGW